MAENRRSSDQLPKYVYSFRRELSAAQARMGRKQGPRRWVFKRNGHTFELPSPVDKSFETRYAEALLQSIDKKIPGKKRLGGVYSVDWLLAEYKQTDDFIGIKDSTRKAKLNLMDRMSNDWGEVDIRKITVPGLAAELARISSPTVRNRVRGIFRQIFSYAVVRGYMNRNVAADVPRAGVKTVSTHGWTPAERSQYCAKWPVGTRERLAFTLLFETVQRSSDVVLMGPGHISGDLKGGVIEGIQVKTGTPYRVPISDRLREALAPVVDLRPFIQTADGFGFSAKGFQQWFGKTCRAAGLPDECRGHGLRAAGCHEIAEGGASAIELMAISGHKTLAEAQKYIQAANKKTLASSAHNKRHASRADLV